VKQEFLSLDEHEQSVRLVTANWKRDSCVASRLSNMNEEPTRNLEERAGFGRADRAKAARSSRPVNPRRAFWFGWHDGIGRLVGGRTDAARCALGLWWTNIIRATCLDTALLLSASRLAA